MTYKFNVGDTVRRIKSNNGSLQIGSIGKVTEVVDNGQCYKIDIDTNCYSHAEDNLELVMTANGKKAKVVPEVLHVVLNTACNNFVQLTKNYEDAVKIVPSSGTVYKVYRLEPVAMLEHTVKVSKIVPEKKIHKVSKKK